MVKGENVSIFSWNRIIVCAAALPVLLLFYWYFHLDLALDDPYEWHVYMGDKYLDIGKGTLAQKHFQKALELDGSRPDAHWGMAVAYRYFGLPEKMAEELEHFKGIPDYASACHFFVGYLLHREGRIDEAVEEYKESLKSDNYAKNWYLLSRYLNLGVAYIQLGNYSEAAYFLAKGVSFVESVHSGETSAKTHYNRKWSMWRAKDINDLAALHAALGIAYQRLGMEGRAQQEFDQMGRLNPSVMETIRLAILGDYFY